MFCCLPLPRGRGLGRAHRQSVWDRWRRWLRAPRGGLWPFARRNRKSFPPDVADEGDTPSTSSREGSEPHPPAREAQCRVQPRAPLPLRQHEDLEPSAAEHRGPPAPGTDVPSPRPKRPPPPAPAPARALAGEPESGHELPPLQGQPALAPAQHPDAHDD
ncbi:skin secretory protein xP2-like [Cervus elaphus]|uniref:skin secretory protein xP2-like n=1 Tax=Cervus elaphus TaxID=9860 RepID=UPI001CC294E7|nr:skin secretory protein xP2-like [Cervus elaphus]